MRIAENCSLRALPNGQEFVGVWKDVSEYSSIVLSALADTNCKVYLDFSPEGIFTDSTLTYDVAANVNEVHRISITRAYARLRVLNDSGSNQTFLRLSMIVGHHTQLTSNLNTTIQSDADALVTRSILFAETSSGEYNAVGTNNPVPIVGNMDAFYRMRVSNPATIFDSKQIGDNQPLFWDDQETAGGSTSSTFNTNQASTTIAVGAAAGTRVRQTFRHFNYQPGKSQLVIMTGVFGAAGTGITKRIGMFNANNGIFFEQISTGMGVVVRTNTSGTPDNTRIAQANWNIDTMDGNGPSGITLNYTKTLIFFMDYEWLGVGTIRYGVYVNGIPYYVHAIHNSNINTVVYMSTPNLPLRYEITNGGTGSAASLVHICTTVITEGGRQQTGIERALNRATDTLTTLNDTNIYPLIGLRLKTTNLGAFIRLLDYTLLCTTTAEYAYYVILNPTIVGTALTWTAVTNSSVEYTYGTNATTLTGGTVITTGIASDSVQAKSGVQRVTESDLVIGSNIAGTPDQIFLAVQRLTGTTETFYSSIIWSETN